MFVSIVFHLFSLYYKVQCCQASGQASSFVLDFRYCMTNTAVNAVSRTTMPHITNLIILVIKQIGLPLRGRPILLITRMITDRIGLHSVLLPLHIPRGQIPLCDRSL